MIIKTNKKMRDLYAKHLNKLYDYADGNFEDRNCYFCGATEYYPGSGYADCSVCPLGPGDSGCSTTLRKSNLRTGEGDRTAEYESATPESIHEHARWIERQIIMETDCEFYWTTK